MTHPPATVAAYLLVDQGLSPAVGGTASWSVYVMAEPDAPESVVTVYDEPGPNFSRTMVSGEFNGFQGLQFRLRGKTYPETRTKADSLIDTLSAVYQRTVTVPAIGATPTATYLVHDVTGLTNVISLGRDRTRSALHLCTVNANLVVTQLS